MKTFKEIIKNQSEYFNSLEIGDEVYFLDKTYSFTFLRDIVSGDWKNKIKKGKVIGVDRRIDIDSEKRELYTNDIFVEYTDTDGGGVKTESLGSFWLYRVHKNDLINLNNYFLMSDTKDNLWKLLDWYKKYGLSQIKKSNEHFAKELNNLKYVKDNEKIEWKGNHLEVKRVAILNGDILTDKRINELINELENN